MQTTQPRSSHAAGRTLVAALLPHRGPARFLGLTAAFWLASAALHTVVFVFSDTAWSGAVSWRKPIVFSLSIGLLLWAFGWILDRLPDRNRLAWPLAMIFAASSSVEVGLIALQQWRGRPSHFNTFADDDAVIFGLMGTMVAVMALMLVGLALWSIIERPNNRLERTAIFAGMAMVVSGLGIGQWILRLGFDYAERFDRVPETVLNGEAGVAKFPHAVAFHGIQVFMLAAVLLTHSSVPTRLAPQLMRLIVGAYAGILAFSALQTFGGRAPLDMDVISGLLLIASTIALAGAMIAAFHWWRTSEPALVDPSRFLVTTGGPGDDATGSTDGGQQQGRHGDHRPART